VGTEPPLIQVERRPGEVRVPGEPIPGVRRLVVERGDRLGDLIVTLPAVAALRAAYPAARLGLLVRESVAPVARIAAGVDEVLTCRGSHDARGALARFAPDLVVLASRGAAMALAARGAGAPHRVGTGRRLYSALFTRTVSERRRRGGRHEVEYTLSFAHRAGARAGAAVFGLDVPADAGAAAERWLDRAGLRAPFVLVHPGSGGSCPAWPPESWAALLAGLAPAGRGLALSIGPADAAVAGCCDRGELRGVPRFDGGLLELAALARRAALVLANSTGPLHLAAALGTPTLALHAAGVSCGPGRWGPYAPNGWALAAPRRDPSSLSVERVRAAVEELLRRPGAREG